MDMRHTQPVCLLAHLSDTSWLWHARYGHLSFDALKKLAQQNMVRGLPRVNQGDQVCDGCLTSKQHRATFPRVSQFRAEKSLQLVHMDLCGPIAPITPGGNRYFILFVDDFSRYMWVHFLQNKSDAFENFKKFKAEVELEKDQKLKMVRSDRGGEFTSEIFKRYCEDLGIKRQLTAPYFPQQNGVVERRNRTIIEMTRSLLRSKDVPTRFWAEAVRTAVYILNRSPTKSVPNMTPYQAWYGKVPSVQHMRVFGSVGHVKNVTPHLKKLEDRSKKDGAVWI